MKRIIVNMPEAMDREIRAFCDRSGYRVSDVVRVAIDEYLTERRRKGSFFSESKPKRKTDLERKAERKEALYRSMLDGHDEIVVEAGKEYAVKWAVDAEGNRYASEKVDCAAYRAAIESGTVR